MKIRCYVHAHQVAVVYTEAKYLRRKTGVFSSGWLKDINGQCLTSLPMASYIYIYNQGASGAPDLSQSTSQIFYSMRLVTNKKSLNFQAISFIFDPAASHAKIRKCHIKSNFQNYGRMEVDSLKRLSQRVEKENM